MPDCNRCCFLIIEDGFTDCDNAYVEDIHKAKNPCPYKRTGKKNADEDFNNGYLAALRDVYDLFYNYSDEDMFDIIDSCLRWGTRITQYERVVTSGMPNNRKITEYM